MLCPNPECPDIRETGKPGEYEAGVAVCPRCGTTLLEVREDRDSPQDVTEQEVTLEPVFETFDPTEVVIVQSMLDAEGIPCQVSSHGLQKHLGGQLSPFPVHPLGSGAVVISVPEELAETAREILSELEETE